MIVTDSVTSNGLADFIASLGGKHFRYKKGYRNIINKGIELNQAGTACPLMMETSGHGAMKASTAAVIVAQAEVQRCNGVKVHSCTIAQCVCRRCCS